MDLLIRNAAVYDGTGTAAQHVDVGVTNGVIDAVGDLEREHAGREVDATGRALAPGFIDVHSHDDFAVFLMPEMDFKVCQGVTTDIVGNCGLGAAPIDSVLCLPVVLRRRRASRRPARVGHLRRAISTPSTANHRAATSPRSSATARCASTPWANARARADPTPSSHA